MSPLASVDNEIAALLSGGGGGLVSVKTFGAAGDGITDDTAAINTALASVTQTGGRLYFPAGIYMVSSTIVVPGSVQIMGTGIDYMSLNGSVGGNPIQASVIKALPSFNTANPLVQMGTILYPNTNWWTDQNTGMTAAYLIFDAAGFAQSAVKTFGTRARLLYCEMRNGNTYAADLSGQNTQCIGCITDNAGVGTASVQINANDVKYMNGEIRNGGTVAHLLITGTTGNSMVVENDIYGANNIPAIKFNVTASTTLGRISNNHINPTTNNGIDITVSASQTLWGGVIANNKFYGNSSGMSGAGFALRVDVTAAASAVDGLIFMGNHISDRSNGTRSGSGWSGIIARASSSGTMRNVVVIGNILNGGSQFFGGTPTLDVIRDNIWINNAGTQAKTNQTGSATFSGDGTTTTFNVTHIIGTAPSNVRLTPTSAASAQPHYVSAKAASTFTITFVTAPASGTNNVTFDWEAIY